MSTPNAEQRARELAWGLVIAWGFSGTLLGFFFALPSTQFENGVLVASEIKEGVRMGIGVLLGVAAGVIAYSIYQANVHQSRDHLKRAIVWGFGPAGIYWVLFLALIWWSPKGGLSAYVVPGLVLTTGSCVLWGVWCYVQSKKQATAVEVHMAGVVTLRCNRKHHCKVAATIVEKSGDGSGEFIEGCIEGKRVRLKVTSARITMEHGRAVS